MTTSVFNTLHMPLTWHVFLTVWGHRRCHRVDMPTPTFIGGFYGD